MIGAKMSMDYVFKVFDYLHSHPEVSGEEIVTSEYLAGELKKSGFKVKEQVNGSRGVIGVWDSGKKGKKIALRADMDALPYIEEGKRVAKHTCGHDAHCAMVLAAAKQIQNHELSGGTLVVIFQPSEETHTGALDMANSGFLNEVDEMIGIHIRPQEEMKAGQATCGLCHGAICLCRVVVDGVSAHGARPQQGRNAVEAAIAMIQSIYSVIIKVETRFEVLTVNEEETEIVRFIFDMYLQGYGTTTIAKRLMELGKKNKKGEVSWHTHGVMGIIKNEKYKGDILLGKTFTTDPISKRRLANNNFSESQ